MLPKVPPRASSKSSASTRSAPSEPPKHEDDARRWIQETFREGSYTLARHFSQRLVERNITLRDVRNAIEKPSYVERYENGDPHHDGTCWRVYGYDLGRVKEVGVGVETYINAEGRRLILCTIFNVEVKR